jgi:hypothetical protein
LEGSVGIRRTEKSGGGGEPDANVVYRAFNSIVSARNLLARQLGELFGGRRNLYDTFGYSQTVSYEEMRRRYERFGIVSRIVNAYPDAMWTRPPQLIEGSGETAAPAKINKAMYEIDKAVGLYHYVNRADRLSGIGKYSLLLLGFDDVKTNDQMEKPVRGSVGLAYVQCFGYGQCQVVEWEDDLKSPYFGLPRIYSLGLALTVNQMTENQPANWVRVHRDRVLHICDSPLDNDVHGYPIIERIYNFLDDSEKVVGGSSELFWLNGRRGLHIDVDKETQFTEAHAKDLRQQVDDFMNDMTRVLRTRGVNIKDLGSSHVNPEPVFNVIMSMISISTGIPQRIFIGSEQGKLASEQDRANWAIRVNERRTLHAEPKILRPLVSRLQRFGVVPGGEFDLQWPEAFQMSPLERGQTSAQQARAATNLVRSMKDFERPTEGVDYPISRSNVTIGGGGSGKFHSAAAAATTAAASGDAKGGPANDNKSKKSDKGDSGKAGGEAAKGKDVPTQGEDTGKAGGTDAEAKPPEAPKPVVIENEQIKVPRRKLISEKEARSIIFAMGELKSEGSIDGVPD